MDLFVARQPILDRAEKLFGYELLFRDGMHAGYTGTDGDGATSRIILEGLSPAGFETLAGQRAAFINVTQEVLITGLVDMLPPSNTVVELLESIEPSPKVVEACRRLRRAGYRIALDDFSREHRSSPLLELADIVKVDFLTASAPERRAIARMLAPRGKTLVAEKVETREDFKDAWNAGYLYFQGYFFSRPVMIASRCVPGVKLRYLEVLSAIQDPHLDYARVEQIVKSDMSLTYRLLRHANSVYAGGGRITSIGNALLRVGEREFRRLVTLVTMAGLAADQPEALVLEALHRARFAELLAAEVGRSERSEEAFVTGMFSLIDTMLGRPMAELVRQIAVSEDVSRALLGESNELGVLLGYVTACGRADWESANAAAATLKLDEHRVPALLAEATAFSQGTRDMLRAAA